MKYTKWKNSLHQLNTTLDTEKGKISEFEGKSIIQKEKTEKEKNLEFQVMHPELMWK